MQCDIYSSIKKHNLYIFVESNRKPSDILPADISKEVGELRFFKSRSINIGDLLIGTQSKEIIDSITEHGYALQSAEIKTYVTEVSAALGAGVLAASLGAPLILASSAAVAAGVAMSLISKEDKEPKK